MQLGTKKHQKIQHFENQRPKYINQCNVFARHENVRQPLEYVELQQRTVLKMPTQNPMIELQLLLIFFYKNNVPIPA